MTAAAADPPAARGARGGPASEALQRYAEARTGLSCHEIAAIFAVVRNDAYDADAPDSDEVVLTLDRWHVRILHDRELPPASRGRLLRLLREARGLADEGVLPDGPTWAATCLIGETAARRTPRHKVDFADGGTVWLTGDRNGPYDAATDGSGRFRVVDVRSARVLVCPCCDGWIRIQIEGPGGDRETLDADLDHVIWSSAHRRHDLD